MIPGLPACSLEELERWGDGETGVGGVGCPPDLLPGLATSAEAGQLTVALKVGGGGGGGLEE